MHKPNRLFEMIPFSRKILPGAVHLLGFPYDETASFRKGAKKGPDDIRTQSLGIESYSPYLHRDIATANIVDLGNLPVGQGQDQTENWRQASDYFAQITHGHYPAGRSVTCLSLGGEHSISYAPIRYYLQQYPNLLLIHLDAHADLRDGYEGFYYSHAAIIRRVVELMGAEHELLQYGIRSGTQEEYACMKKMKSRCTSREAFLDQVNNTDDHRPIYLTLDVDYFDPSFLPGTGNPEAGGEDFHSFIRLNKLLAKKRLVGADVVELAPAIDVTGNSGVFAAIVTRELLLGLSQASRAWHEK